MSSCMPTAAFLPLRTMFLPPQQPCPSHIYVLHICTQICSCVCTHATHRIYLQLTHTLTYIQSYLHICKNTHTLTYTFTCILTGKSTITHNTCIHMCAYIHVHSHIHPVYAYTYTQMHIHTHLLTIVTHMQVDMHGCIQRHMYIYTHT